jgi:sugar phosphate isomerase/epimerase
VLFSLDTDYVARGTFKEKISALAEAGFTHVNIRANVLQDLMSGSWSKEEEIKKILKDFRLAVDWIHTSYECLNLQDDSLACRATQYIPIGIK